MTTFDTHPRLTETLDTLVDDAERAWSRYDSTDASSEAEETARVRWQRTAQELALFCIEHQARLFVAIPTDAPTPPAATGTEASA